MTDPVIKTLLVAGLLVQATAIGVGFTSVGWRWPIIAAASLVSLGTIFVVVADGGKMDGAEMATIGFSVAVLGLAAGHAFSTHPAIVWPLRVGIAVQFLVLALFFATMFFFKMGRLF